MKRGIDVHCHLFPETYLALVRSTGASAGTRLVPGDGGIEQLRVPGIPAYTMAPDYRSPDALVAWMDEAGLEKVVLTPAPPAVAYWEPVEFTREATAALNEGMAAAAQAYPDRILAAATVTLNDPARAPAELRAAVQRYGLRAALILTNVNGRNLDEPEFFDFFATAAELQIPVFVHPNPVTPLGRERLQRYYLHNVIGMTTDTTVAIASLIFGGVLERLPGLCLWFAHAGGSFALLLGRMEHAYRVRPEAQGTIPHPPSAYVDRLAFDTLAHEPAALKYVLSIVGSQRLMIGSDYPFAIGTRRPLDIVDRLEELSEEACAAILEENARRLFALG